MRVENRVPLGPTRIVRSAILAGEIDLYPEYTGNGAFFFQMEADPAWKDAQAGLREGPRPRRAAQQHRLAATRAGEQHLGDRGARRPRARPTTLRTLEDVAGQVSAGRPFKLAASAEFVESPAALPAFQTAYGFTLPPDRLLVLPGGDTAVTMRAAAQQLNGVNAAMVYGTDGGIAALDLKVLEDTKKVQPVYAPAPVMRSAVLSANPRDRRGSRPGLPTLELTVLQRLNAQHRGRGPAGARGRARRTWPRRGCSADDGAPGRDRWRRRCWLWRCWRRWLLGFAVLAPNRIVPPRGIALGDVQSWGMLAPAALAAIAAAALLPGRLAALACGVALCGLLGGLGDVAGRAGRPHPLPRGSGRRPDTWIAIGALLLAARLALGRAGCGSAARRASRRPASSRRSARCWRSACSTISAWCARPRRAAANCASAFARASGTGGGGAAARARGRARPGGRARLRLADAPARRSWACWRRLQVIPAMALFALLIEPLAALGRAVPLLREAGLRGIGAAPAVIGVFLYLLLPIAAATRAALGAAPAAAVDAARGLGFAPRQVLSRVRLPLGAPVLLGGLRTATVQAVGLVTLGALVGAGGFGVLMFQGLGQFAPDLILLGALPVAALALLLDSALRALEEGLGHHPTGAA